MQTIFIPKLLVLTIYPIIYWFRWFVSSGKKLKISLMPRPQLLKSVKLLTSAIKSIFSISALKNSKKNLSKAGMLSTKTKKEKKMSTRNNTKLTKNVLDVKHDFMKRPIGLKRD